MGVLSTIFGSGDVISKGMDLIDSFHTSDVEMHHGDYVLSNLYQHLCPGDRYDFLRQRCNWGQSNPV
jgi:hypothetical protein